MKQQQGKPAIKNTRGPAADAILEIAKRRLEDGGGEARRELVTALLGLNRLLSASI